MAEMIFAGIETAFDKPGKKLTKNDFKQIQLEDIREGYDHDKSREYSLLCSMGFPPQQKTKGWRDFTEDLNSLKGSIIGWVEYVWKGCSRNEISYCETEPSFSKQWYHVFWKTSKGELRRTFVFKEDKILANLVKEKGQIFLGDYFSTRH